MGITKRRLLEDRMLRDAARRNVSRDIDLMRADVEQKSVGARMADASHDQARHAGIVAGTAAREKPVEVATVLTVALAGLAVLWFREPIAHALRDLLGLEVDDSAVERPDSEEQVPPEVRSNRKAKYFFWRR